MPADLYSGIREYHPTPDPSDHRCSECGGLREEFRKEFSDQIHAAGQRGGRARILIDAIMCDCEVSP